jgi:hypothetical protein
MAPYTSKHVPLSERDNPMRKAILAAIVVLSLASGAYGQSRGQITNPFTIRSIHSMGIADGKAQLTNLSIELPGSIRSADEAVVDPSRTGRPRSTAGHHGSD